MHSTLIWAIAAAAIVAILFRPRGWPEAVWACGGAAMLTLAGLLPFARAMAAIWKGADVYLFLAGMMLLSELARREGVFDWLASHAVAAAKGSCTRLFGLIYLVGTAVTVFLSNDATAVVLTPAVAVAVRKARTEARPYLLICAFIANAASFVLPISNPANLVIYGKHLPPLLPWLKTFLLPSICSVGVTYAALRWICRQELAGQVSESEEAIALTPSGRWAACSILVTGAVLIVASAFGRDLGLPTFVCAAAAVVLVNRTQVSAWKEIATGVSWSVLPMVAGLFVLVEAVQNAGALWMLQGALAFCRGLTPVAGSLAASFGIAAVSNLVNNLPSGLLAGAALQQQAVSAHLRNAVLIGIDLGPNLSVTGSLATLLWLAALRREGETITAWEFLKAGLVVMPPALLAATVTAALLS